MFRFIHAADIHLDSPLRGLPSYETAPVDAIKGACREAFKNLVSLAIEEKVSFVLLAGDLFDGDWKDYNSGIFLSHQMGILKSYGISVYVVKGNHDAENKVTKALELPSNMTILSSRTVETIKIKELEVAIHGQSFALQSTQENLAEKYPQGLRDMFNIGLLHTSLDGRAGHASYAPCSTADLRSKGYQYWALGHVHQQEEVSRDPWIVFPGCVQGRHIRENGAKGCALVTVEDNTVGSVEWRSLDVFRWSLCSVDLSEVDDMREALERTGQVISRERALAEERPLGMRLRFEGTTPLAGELAAYPEKFTQEIRRLGAELAGEALWIEKIENRTTDKLDLKAVLAENSTRGSLLKEILSIKDAEGVVGLGDILKDVKRVPSLTEACTAAGLDLDNVDYVTGLIQEAKHLLAGRLLSKGGA